MRAPFVIALIGLVGSGKSSVAKEFARLTGAKLLSADAERFRLHKKGYLPDQIREIMEEQLVKTLAQGRSVIMDSDFITSEKRTSLLTKTRTAGIPVSFIHVIADPDVMIGRMLSSRYSKNDLFGSASTTWNGSTSERGAVVKLREFWRRTPHHFVWNADGGGQWKRKASSLKETLVDTTNKKIWKKKVAAITKKLKGKK